VCNISCYLSDIILRMKEWNVFFTLLYDAVLHNKKFRTLMNHGLVLYLYIK